MHGRGDCVPPGASQGWGLTVGLSRVLALCPRGLTEKQLFQSLMDWEGVSEDEVGWPRLCLGGVRQVPESAGSSHLLGEKQKQH